MPAGIVTIAPPAVLSVPLVPLAAGRPMADTVQRVDPAQHPDWEAFLASGQNDSFFHGKAWAKVLGSTYGYAPVYLAVSEAGALRSLLPLMEVDSRLTGRRGVALPFTDDCEPFYSDDGSVQRVIQSAMDLGRARGWKYVEFRGGRNLFENAPASLSFYGHALDLAWDEKCLFSRLKSSVRRAIRKAVKAGVTVEVARTLEAVRTFYSLHCQTRRRQGLPPQSFAFFRNIHEHILSRGLGIVALARYQGRVIAAAVHFHSGRQAIFKYGASDKAFQHLRGSNLVMWEAIKWHARNGANKLHLGRTSIANEGLRHFKLGWGAKEELIEYVKYDLLHDRFVVDPSPSGWHNRVFNVLPIFASRLIGAGLYKHWA